MPWGQHGAAQRTSPVWWCVLAVAVGSASITMMVVPGFTPMNVSSVGHTMGNRGANIWQAPAWTLLSANRSSPRFLPAALELSLTATERVEQERAELDRL